MSRLARIAFFGAMAMAMAGAAWAQSPAALLTPAESVLMGLHVTQLMSASSATVPGLARASELLRQSAEAASTVLRGNGKDPVATVQLIRQLRAYLAVADSLPRPNVFPAAAAQQFTDLRDALQRLEQHFDALLAQQEADAKAQGTDPNNVKRYADANSKVTQPSDTLTRVVFLGDAATERWKLIDYFTGQDFYNRGIGGQTTGLILGRFVADVVALHPKGVLILAGSEDIAAGIKPSAIADNLVMMGDVAKAHGIQPMFASLLPVSAEAAKSRPLATIKQLNQWIRDYCIRESFIFVDYNPAMADAQGLLKADLSDDGLHPNAKGYKAMAPIALDALERLEILLAPDDPTRRRGAFSRK